MIYFLNTKHILPFQNDNEQLHKINSQRRENKKQPKHILSPIHKILSNLFSNLKGTVGQDSAFGEKEKG